MSKEHLFGDGEEVRIRETGEVVTIDHWWFSTSGMLPGAQYNIVGYSTWFAEDELEKK